MPEKCEATVRPAAAPRGTAVITLRGELDGDAKALLPAAYADAVAANDPAEVLLDLTDVGYINSTGIAVIVGVLATARTERRAITAAGLTEHYKHIFTITRLVDFISLVDQPSQEQTWSRSASA